jgi:molybdenum cofactor cytidylyltransferase
MSPFVGRIVVVGGHHVDLLREIVAGTPNVEVIFNAQYEAGMFSSVRAGLRHTTAARVFLLPGDHPLVRKEVYHALLDTTGDVVVPSYRGNKGHPVLMSRWAVDETLRAAEDATLRQVTERLGCTVTEVADRGILLDVDNPDDFDAVRCVYEHDNQ